MVASRSNSFDCPIALFYQFPNLFGRLFEKNLTGERTVFPSIDVGHEKGERHQGARFVLSTIEEWHVSITFYPWKVTLNSFAIEDGLHFMTLAAQALSQDEFSKCFEPKPLQQSPGFSIRYVFYMIGSFIRYCVLFPFRLTILFVGASIFALLLPFALLSHDEEHGKLLFLLFCKVWLFSFSAYVRHHGKKPSPDAPHIFVANHTSFTDFFLMSSHKFPHATVAQIHGGLFGLLQRHALSLNGSLFFYRDESKDKEKLAKKMRSHTESWRSKSPLIIFPEGTCVNNEYTVLFHKGAFELGCEVCPVAIKYNKRLLDPYWNTREQSFTQHILYLMTRWFMIADVWWLPPQRKAPGESSIDFANRVKAMISEAAGLKNLSWDGYLKNYVRQHDHEKLRKGTQAKYVHSLRVKLPQLLGDEYVKTQTDHLIDSDDDKVIRRRRASCSFIDVEPSRVTQLKNEVLVSSPIEICRPTSGGEVKESSFLEHLSYEKDSLVRSWKQFSLMAQLDSSKDASRNEDRLDYSGWRLWSKHRKETKAKTTQETIGILEELSTSSEALDALRS